MKLKSFSVMNNKVIISVKNNDTSLYADRNLFAWIILTDQSRKQSWLTLRSLCLGLYVLWEGSYAKPPNIHLLMLQLTMCLMQRQSKAHQQALLVKWVCFRKQSGSSYLITTRCHYNSADLTKCLIPIKLLNQNYWQVKKWWDGGYISEEYNR